eukprot:2256726-Rhodomonas_salina.1
MLLRHMRYWARVWWYGMRGTEVGYGGTVQSLMAESPSLTPEEEHKVHLYPNLTRKLPKSLLNYPSGPQTTQISAKIDPAMLLRHARY